MGVACMKNTILMGSKDSISEMEKRSYLKLSKQEGNNWMEVQKLQDFCTNTVQLKLEG